MSWLTDIFHTANGDTAAAAAKSAAGIQQQTADQNKALAQDYTGQNLSDIATAGTGATGAIDAGGNAAIGAQQPYAQAGGQSLTALMAALGLSGPEAGNKALSDFQTSPGYQFRLGQGIDAMERGANAKGGIYSGAEDRALTEYGQNYASNEWANHLKSLSDMAGMGQNSANTSSGILSQMALAKANALLGVGNAQVGARTAGLGAMTDAANQSGAAQAGGIVNAANAHTNAFNQALNAAVTVGTSFLPGGHAMAPAPPNQQVTAPQPTIPNNGWGGGY